MTPFLLDRNSINKALLALAVVLGVVFYGGYQLGALRTIPAQQHADSTQPVTDVSETMTALISNESEHALNQIQVALLGDSFDHVVLEASDQQGSVAAIDSDNATAAITETDAVQQPVAQAIVNTVQEKAVIADNTAQQYVIQLGVYAQHGNAQRAHASLTSHDFNGFISDYLNKQDETRYNLRIGPFNSYAEAKQVLLAYQQRTNGSGYVLKVND